MLNCTVLYYGLEPVDLSQLLSFNWIYYGFLHISVKHFQYEDKAMFGIAWWLSFLFVLLYALLH